MTKTKVVHMRHNQVSRLRNRATKFDVWLRTWFEVIALHLGQQGQLIGKNKTLQQLFELQQLTELSSWSDKEHMAARDYQFRSEQPQNYCKLKIRPERHDGKKYNVDIVAQKRRKNLAEHIDWKVVAEEEAYGRKNLSIVGYITTERTHCPMLHRRQWSMVIPSQ